MWRRACLGVLAVFVAGALLAVPSAGASSAGGSGLGDVTDVSGWLHEDASLGGAAGDVLVWGFELSEPRRVVVRLRRLDAGADVAVLNASGETVAGGDAAGTARERVSVTLLAGEYSVRATAVEAGANVLRMSLRVRAADPVVVAELEAAAQPATAEPATTEPVDGSVELTGPDPGAEQLQAQAQQSDPDKDSDGGDGGVAVRGHDFQHVAASDVVLDFGTVNLTGAAGDYKVRGLHMDATHVYVLLVKGSSELIYKFEADGDYVGRSADVGHASGLAGSSTLLYVGVGNASVLAYTKALARSSGDDEYIDCCAPGANIREQYAFGDLVGTTFVYTARERQYVESEGSTREGPKVRGAMSLTADDLEPLGLTLSKMAEIDLATDGSTLLYLENGDGTGAFAFDVVSGTEQRNALADAYFGSGTYDGLFFDGDTLWTLDVDSFDATADQFTLRAFEAGAPTVPEVDEVTTAAFDGGLVRVERTRGGSVPFPNHGNDIDGDGTVDFTMFAREGFTPQGLWGDSDHLYVVDQHTAGVYAVSLDDLIGDATGGGSIAYGRSYGPGMLAQDRLNHRHSVGLGDRYMWLSAMWADEGHIWVSDDNNPWLRAYGRGALVGGRDESQDILLYKDGHGLMALGIWSDGDTMWVNALPYRSYGGRPRLSYGIYTVDLADGSIAKAAGFSGLHDAEGNRAKGIWSDGETMWAATPNGRIQAYDLDTGARSSHFDIVTTDRNEQPLQPGGLWSDGEYMFYGDEYSGSIYIYQLTD